MRVAALHVDEWNGEANSRRTQQTDLLVGRRVCLRPVTQGDYDFLRTQEQSAPDVVSYRHRGRSISPESYPESLWASVLTQHLVVETATNKVVGVVVSYGADFMNGTAKLAGFTFGPFRSLGWPVEGLRIMIDFVFYAFPLRKLYAEVLEPNLARFGRGFPGLLHEEGRLMEHAFVGGVYVDQVTLALTRERWFRDPRGHLRRSGLLDVIRGHGSADDS